MPVVEVIEYKSKWYVDPKVVAGDNGSGGIIRVELKAATKITSVQLIKKEGTGSRWTHECPDGGYCPELYRNPVELHGLTAYWNGWSNSGEECVLYFRVTSE